MKYRCKNLTFIISVRIDSIYVNSVNNGNLINVGEYISQLLCL